MVQLVRSSSPHDAGGFGALSQQLAQALRGWRLTVVVAAAGADLSALLDSVLPLLRRRAIDNSTDARTAGGVVVPFPDRRQHVEAGAPHERIHTMAHWDDASMQALQRALDEGGPARGRRALADALTPGSLADQAERFDGARLLFVFDHFEELLEAGRIRIGHRRLVETWAAAVRSPQLRANFLVAMDERSWPWLHAVCVGLPQGSWNALRLRAQGAALALEPIDRPLQVPPRLTRTAPGIVPPLGRPQTGEQFLRSVNERVRRVAQSAKDDHAHGKPFAARLPHLVEKLASRAAAVPSTPAPPTATPAVAEQPSEEPPAVQPLPQEPPLTAPPEAAAALAEPTMAKAPPAAPEVLPTPPYVPATTVTPASAPAHAPDLGAISIPSPTLPTTRAPRRWPLPAWLGLAVLAIAIGLGLWRIQADERVATAAPSAAPSVSDAPSSTTTAAAAPSPQTAPPVTAAFGVLGASATGEHARIARDLAAALAGDATPLRVEPLAADTDAVAWLQRSPGRLGVARWDALRAAAQGGQAAPLRVLTPLFAEPVLFIVRADSPLRTLRQLQGARINVGPAGSDAAHTVNEIHRRLFGTPLTPATALAPEDALAELVAFQSIDAIAVVDAQPMAWWSTLDPAMARRLRVLTLDPTHPRDQRLLDSMGTQPLHVASPGGQRSVALVPAVMSYLVASGDTDAWPDDRLTAMAQALCRELPQLQQQGHAAWRDLRPRAQTDTGWPVVGAFRTTLSRCARR